MGQIIYLSPQTGHTTSDRQQLRRNNVFNEILLVTRFAKQTDLVLSMLFDDDA
jgi:hypothetical protein